MDTVIKGFLTDVAMTDVKAQQVYGGHGYIREWGNCPSSPAMPVLP